jgi:NAD(P)-dependent dehydrogenase (short-subunit alcohol dehydrogenase family)
MNILFTRELARRIAGTGVTANAVHPGAVSTNLGAPPKFLAAILSRFIKSQEQGAFTSLVVATDPALAEVSGGYFADSKRAEGKLSKSATDDDLARELWTRSEALVGIAP